MPSPRLGTPFRTRVIDTNPGGSFHPNRISRSSRFEPYVSLRATYGSIVPPVNSQSTCEPPWPIELFHAPDQYGRWVPLRTRHKIQHPVNPVAQIHIPMTGRPEHNRVSGCLAFVSMGCPVFKTIVSFHFYNPSSQNGFLTAPNAQNHSQKGRSDFRCPLVEKLTECIN